MTDLTSSLSTILVQSHAKRPLATSATPLHESVDAFLAEAYQINRSIRSLLKYLRAIRQPYLSTAPPPRRNNANNSKSQVPPPQHVAGFGDIPTYLNDSQREDIDSQTARLLNDINRNISNLASAAKLQNDTATQKLERKYGKPSGFLFRWAAGDADEDAGKGVDQLAEEGAVKTRYMFREGVIWYLNYNLRDVVGLQEGMVSIRLEREREKKESVLWDSRNKNYQSEVMKNLGTDEDEAGQTFSAVDVRGKDVYNPALDSTGAVSGMGELSPEQLQLFEEENNSLLNHYTDTLAKVTQAEKSLVDISSLQQTLVGHLTVQGEMIGQLVEDASRTDENVRRGNKELKKASERGSTARGVFWGTVSLCSFLIVWDLIF